MSIIGRLDDARVLYEAGRLEGALLSLLVAVAATSRKRYPREPGGKNDREAFTAFLTDEFGNLTGSIANVPVPNVNVEFRGEMTAMPDLPYKYVRCELAHEGTMPDDVVFVRDDYLLLKGGDRLVLNEAFLQGLANVVLGAVENAGEVGRTPPVGVPGAEGHPAMSEPGGEMRACLIGLPLDFTRPIIYHETDRTTFRPQSVGGR